LERVYRSHGLVSENIDLNATRGSIIFFRQAKTVSKKSALVSIEERLGHRRNRIHSAQRRGGRTAEAGSIYHAAWIIAHQEEDDIHDRFHKENLELVVME
jgi:hypothetical protein